MKRTYPVLGLVLLLATACSSAPKLFSKKTPHEAYAEKLDDNDLEKTPAGRQWLAASKSALTGAPVVTLPYKQQGYFGSDKPRALGLRFTAQRGEQLRFTLIRKGTTPFTLYADLFRGSGSAATLFHAADTTINAFQVEVEETGEYTLRLQPELFRSGSYELSIAIGPSLGFPVSGGKAKAGSFWGADRDGGKRRHEGVDIFAPKRTPVVAAADGVVTGVKEAGIGGKVVWLRVKGRPVTLYYAHLDEQLVQEGQVVKKGEVLGLVGNTGNAKYTPSHLHFGVYTYTGPVDPYPFINPVVKQGTDVPRKSLSGALTLLKARKLGARQEWINANTVLVPLAVTAKGYLAELPDGSLTEVAFGEVKLTPVKGGSTVAGTPTSGAAL